MIKSIIVSISDSDFDDSLRGLARLKIALKATLAYAMVMPLTHKCAPSLLPPSILRYQKQDHFSTVSRI